MSRVMIIAGTDSSGGAGLTRDTAVASMLGLDVSPVLTAVTAQTNAAVAEAVLMAPEFVAAQIETSLASHVPKAIKIGMLGSQSIAEAVADTLARTLIPIVLDPVIRSTSGGRLISGRFPDRLSALADLVTPNLHEAAIMTDREVARDTLEIAMQARMLRMQGFRAVLIKGGHGDGVNSVDHLFDGSGHRQFIAQRLATNKRGTGCTLATAIACHLASGRNLSSACDLAKSFTHFWLNSRTDFARC